MRSNYYLSYNGRSTRDIGDIIVTKSPVASRPRRKQEVINVPGRNGDIVLYQDAYEDVQKSYEIVAGNGTDGSTGSKFDEIASWLMPEDTEPTVEDYINLTLNGYKHLVDGSNPNYTQLARVTNGFDVDQMLTRAGKATLSFSCRPERYLSDSFLPIIIDSSTTTKSGVVCRFDDDAIRGTSLTMCTFSIPYTDSGLTQFTISKTGRNTIRYPYSLFSPYTTNGKTFTVQSDGSIVVTGGPATGDAVYDLWGQNAHDIYQWFPEGLFFVSGFPSSFGDLRQAYLYITGYDYGTNRNIRVIADGEEGLERFSVVAGRVWRIQAIINEGCVVNGTIYPSIIYSGDSPEIWESPVNNHFYDIDWSSVAGTIYGGTYDALTGVLTSKYASDGSLLPTPQIYQLEPLSLSVLSTDRYIWGSDQARMTIRYTSSQTITNPTDRKAKPVIKVNCSGDGSLTIGDSTITLTGLTDYIYIDSESENCFRTLSENMNSHVSVSGGFPVLQPGQNSYAFGGDITTIEIYPRWWKL